MFDLNKTVGQLLILLAICLFVRPAEAGYGVSGEITTSGRTSTYIFLPDQSTVVQTGGIAGVHWTYSIEGQFQLTFDPNAGTAFFSQVDANAVDDSPYRRTLDPNEVFNMTGLVGIIIDDTIIVFTGKAADGSDVLIVAILNDDLIYLVGQTYPPIGSADFFVFSMDAAAQRKYGGGTGEPNDPYQIYTAEQMNTIGTEHNDWDKHFKLMVDIDLSSYSETTFNIIGRYIRYPSSGYKPFSGVFDGNGYRISNLSFSYIIAQQYIGVFGYVEGAEIKDLGLIDPNVSLNDGGNRVGLLAGWLHNSTITNCYVEGGSISGSNVVGGLVGDSYNSTIKNSHFQGSVFGGSGVGGLVGWNRGTIINCYSNGQVSATGQQVGGLVGDNSGTISNSTTSANVSGTKQVGGLVGWNRGGRTIDCCATGSVIGDEEIGGLVGGNNGIIATCYTTSDVAGKMYVGGFAGQNGLNLSDVVWSGHIYNCYAIGDIQGKTLVGGLVGYNDKWGTICNCYAAGGVSGVEEVGGLVGQDRKGEVINSFWDIETSGQLTSAAGNGKATTQMQDPNTFIDAGWDFAGYLDGPHDIWAEPVEGEYPILWWQLSPLHLLPEFSGGTGKPNDPYLIASAAELNMIGHNPRLMEANFKLVADIDLTNVNFFMIGNNSFPFSAVFDGNGKRIFNFSHTVQEISQSSIDENSVGFFRCVSGGEIKNLGIIDPNIVAMKRDWPGPHWLGTMICWLRGGRVTSCYVQGGSISGSGGVGGLVASNYGIIVDCHTDISIAGGEGVGGLVGGNTGQISNCYSTGDIGGKYSVGGLAGGNSGQIFNCYSTGNVSASNNNVGGLAGNNKFDGEIINCYATGNVTGRHSIGGLVGYNSGLSTLYAKIFYCYATGSVEGLDNVGGLVAHNWLGVINDCYSTSDVSGSENVGGLVGNLGSGEISYCYSTGRIEGEEDFGGLVGIWEEGSVNSSFWDIETSGLTTSAGGMDKTIAEMRTASTFLDAGWDFIDETENGTEDIWWILEGHDYPRLTWELDENQIDRISN